MEIEIRDATEADLPKLNSIVNNPEVCRFLDVEFPVEFSATQGLYHAVLENKENSWFWRVASIDGELVGSLTIMPKAKGTKRAHVADLGIMVAKDFWGKGVGKALMLDAEEKMKTAGIVRIQLEASEKNKRALALYESAGYNKEGQLKSATMTDGKLCDSIVMGKIL